MTNNKQQTAVEWLYDELFKSFQKLYTLQFTMEEYQANNVKLYLQAKEMEKEQHLETHQEGMKYVQYIRDITNGKSEYWKKEVLNFTNYYNETYGNEQQ